MRRYFKISPLKSFGKTLRSIISLFFSSNQNIIIQPRNLFIYWTGKSYKLISILNRLINLHSYQEKGYKVIFLKPDTVAKYIDIPECFMSLLPAHQADYIRVKVIYKYGGIWVDADTLIIEGLDSLFEIIEKDECFFVRQNQEIISNAVFGATKGHQLIGQWSVAIDNIILKKAEKIGWTEIGNHLINRLIVNKDTESNFIVVEGLSSIYPVNWDKCIEEYLDFHYDHYEYLIRDFQPVLILVHSLYHRLESLSSKEIFESKFPLNYFITKSFSHLELKDVDFVEIGTSSFDTLIETSEDSQIGYSVEPIGYYLNKLPDKKNITKIQCAITDGRTSEFGEIFYIPEKIIRKNKLPLWLRGCNSLGDYHLLHKRMQIEHLVIKKKIKLLNIDEFLLQNKIRNVKYLKIDTEGHDIVILKGLFNWIRYLPTSFYPSKIKFESNEHYSKEDLQIVINEAQLLDYKLVLTGHDTILQLE